MVSDNRDKGRSASRPSFFNLPTPRFLNGLQQTGFRTAGRQRRDPGNVADLQPHVQWLPAGLWNTVLCCDSNYGAIISQLQRDALHNRRREFAWFRAYFKADQRHFCSASSLLTDCPHTNNKKETKCETLCPLQLGPRTAFAKCWTTTFKAGKWCWKQMGRLTDKNSAVGMRLGQKCLSSRCPCCDWHK